MEKSNKSGIIKLIVNKTLRMNFIYIMNIIEKEEKELSEERRIFFLSSNFRPWGKYTLITQYFNCFLFEKDLTTIKIQNNYAVDIGKV